MMLAKLKLGIIIGYFWLTGDQLVMDILTRQIINKNKMLPRHLSQKVACWNCVIVTFSSWIIPSDSIPRLSLWGISCIFHCSLALLSTTSSSRGYGVIRLPTELWKMVLNRSSLMVSQMTRSFMNGHVLKGPNTFPSPSTQVTPRPCS